MAGRQYTVRVTAETFDFVYASDGSATTVTPANTDSGTLVVGDVTSGLADAVNNIDGYEAEVIGNVIKIARTDNRSFNLGTRGGTTNRAMTAVKSSAQDLAQLPNQCWDGFRIKVINTAEADADDYYVEFKSDSPGIPGQGSWEETTAQNIPNIINSSTMPYALIRQESGDFIFQPLDNTTAFGGWAPREVGDEDTAPAPSFVGNGISGMFFYQNRLGLLANDAVVMSQPGDYFNFWPTSAIAISDADPIDITAASTKPAFLKYAQGSVKGLLLFAENTQFLLTANETIFSPNSVRLNEIADYNFRSNTQPVQMGLSIGFVTEAETYSKVFEMVVETSDNRPQVAEITRAIPEYIPPGLTWASSSPNNSLAAWGDDSDTCYVFKFFNQGNERQVAGWSKWVMPAKIRMLDFDNDTCFIVTYDENGYYALSTMEMLDDPDTSPITSNFGTKFAPRLDLLQYKADLMAEAGTNKVYFPEGTYCPGSKPVVMITSGEAQGSFERPEIQEDGQGYYVELDTFTHSQDYVLGLEYRMEVQLPAFYVQQEQRPDRVDNPVVELLYLDLYQSGRYQIEIDKTGWDPLTYDVDVAQSDVYLANDPMVEEVGTESVPIFSLGKICYTKIYADDPVPAAITGYSWQGHYNKRGIRII